MKLFKKAVAVMTAAALTASALSLSAFAEGKGSVYAKSENAVSVGDIVNVQVYVNTNGLKLHGVTLNLNYDTTAFESQIPTEEEFENDDTGELLKKYAPIAEKGFLAVFTGDETGLGLGCMSATTVANGEEVLLFDIPFKVKKLDGDRKFTLSIASIANSKDEEVTDQFEAPAEPIVIKCAHKNVEVKTEIEDCEKGGKKTTICKDCGETVKTEDVAAAEHTVDKWNTTKPATCSEEGTEEGTCTVCGKTVTRPIAKVAHTPGEWTVDKEATCTAAGEKSTTCTVCGTKLTEEIPALGHDWSEWKIVEEPTTEKEGKEERECKVCKEKETRPIAKLDPPVTTTPEATTTPAAATTTPDAATTTPAAATTTAAPSGGNAGGDKNDGNVNTGVIFAIIPVAAACAGVVLFKNKRK